MYQLPAVTTQGKVTVVVAPIIALIKDQLDHLSKKGIVGESINNKTNKAELMRIFSDLSKKPPKTTLLYVTPEQCATSKFQQLLRMLMNEKKLAFIVIDEAHCVTMWGGDFRPAYNELGKLREITLSVPWVALTATSSTKVEKQITSILKFREQYKRFKLPCFRSNLFYDVVFKDPSNVSIRT